VPLLHTSHPLLLRLLLHGVGRSSRWQDKGIRLTRYLHHLDRLQDFLSICGCLWIITQRILILLVTLGYLHLLLLLKLNLLMLLLLNCIAYGYEYHDGCIGAVARSSPHADNALTQVSCTFSNKENNTIIT